PVVVPVAPFDLVGGGGGPPEEPVGKGACHRPRRLGATLMGVTRARRRWPRVLLGAWIAFMVVASTSVALFVRPVVDKPTPSDAIVLFAGGGDRIALARKLAAEHLAPITVVSN